MLKRGRAVRRRHGCTWQRVVAAACKIETWRFPVEANHLSRTDLGLPCLGWSLDWVLREGMPCAPQNRTCRMSSHLHPIEASCGVVRLGCIVARGCRCPSRPAYFPVLALRVGATNSKMLHMTNKVRNFSETLVTKNDPKNIFQVLPPHYHN